MAPRFKTKKHTLSGGWESLQSIFAAQDLYIDDYIGAVTVRAAMTTARRCRTMNRTYSSISWVFRLVHLGCFKQE